jgi:hypothetical protein
LEVSFLGVVVVLLSELITVCDALPLGNLNFCSELITVCDALPLGNLNSRAETSLPQKLKFIAVPTKTRKIVNFDVFM